MYIKRTIESVIKQANNFFSVVLITGPRQVGKTTVFQNCEDVPKRYVSLDVLDNRELAIRDPRLFLEKYPYPLLIDEIQYAPELFPYIKNMVDVEKKSGMYWLTGSQQFSLMKNVTESLAGRVGILKLQGLSQMEKFNYQNSLVFLPTKEYIEEQEKREISININELYKTIWKGSYPKLYLNSDENWEMFYESYLQTYLERDIKQISNVINELSFINFMRVMAARTGQLLNYADIARDVGISHQTAKSWLSILKTSGIIYLLEPYYNNLSKRLVKTPKIYFLDTGLACYLTKWKTPELLENGAMNGAILETYIVSEILKNYWHKGKSVNIYFYRDKDMKEIDLIIEENGKLYPIEIKKKSEPNKDDIKHFSVLNKFNKPIGEGAVICLAQTWLPITRGVNRIPISYL